MCAWRRSGRLQLRIAHLAQASPGLAYEPPRSTRSPSPVSVAVHSQTLPAMSWRPYGLAPRGCAPTGDVVPCLRPEPTAARLASSSSPHGNRRPSVPRARLLPLRLGRQPPARPGAERGRVVPVDERHGMVVGRGPVRRPPGAALRDEARVLRVRDRRPAELEGVDVDDVVLALRVAPDRVVAARDVDPVEVGARDRRRRRGSRRTGRAPPGATGNRYEQRSSFGPLRYDPPRTASPLVHSQTLPAMSRAPNADAPAGCRPASDGAPIPAANVARERSGSSSPHGQSRSSLPRAAASHSSSRREPHALPRAERLRLGPRDVRDRSVVALAVEAAVRHRHARDPERVERDDAPRALVLVRRERVGAARAPSGTARPAPEPSRSRRSAGITGSTTSPPKTVCSATSMRVCRPIGSPVFGFRSRRGKFDEETSTRIR